MNHVKTADSTSLVSKNVRIEGEVEGPENLHIEGYVKGAIVLTGDIFVGNTGIVEADLEAKNIVIQGEVTGNVKAHQQLEIHPSGKLIGDCSAGSIDIKEGAVFEGRSMMMKSTATARQRIAPAPKKPSSE
jgi:cytoskeletal protein CcmA (bactofilin family)